jgi:hypothetical protein
MRPQRGAQRSMPWANKKVMTIERVSTAIGVGIGCIIPKSFRSLETVVRPGKLIL